MWGSIARVIEARRAVRRDAVMLLSDHGREGWHIARARMINMRLSEPERGHWSRVASAIETRLDMPPRQTDTATRWLER